MQIKEYEKVRSLLVERLKIDGNNVVDIVETLDSIETQLISILDSENIIITRRNIDKLVKSYYDDIFGLGPLQELLNDTSVNDIMVNGTSSLYIERAGKLIRLESIFKNNDQIMRVAQRIVAAIGRRVDESSPMVDARLQDGSRVNIIVSADSSGWLYYLNP